MGRAPVLSHLDGNTPHDQGGLSRHRGDGGPSPPQPTPPLPPGAPPPLPPVAPPPPLLPAVSPPPPQKEKPAWSSPRTHPPRDSPRLHPPRRSPLPVLVHTDEKTIERKGNLVSAGKILRSQSIVKRSLAFRRHLIQLSVLQRNLLALEPWHLDLEMLPNWLFQKERDSVVSYFKSNVSNGRSWEYDSVTEGASWGRDIRRARALRIASRFFLTKIGLQIKLHQLLPVITDNRSWTLLNELGDCAKLNKKYKVALSNSWDTISVLLIMLIHCSDGYTLVKVLELLLVLLEEYSAKLLMANLGGIHILCQMILSEEVVAVKKVALLVISSVWQAPESVIHIMKEGVERAAVSALIKHGPDIITEFTVLVSSIQSEDILQTFFADSSKLMAGNASCYTLAISTLQKVGQRIQCWGQSTTEWDWDNELADRQGGSDW